LKDVKVFQVGSTEADVYLELDSIERARGAKVRGGELSVLDTPLGQLLGHALFREGRRGLSKDYNYQTQLLSWVTAGKKER